MEISIDISLPEPPPIINELLKKATASYRNGDINSAITYLKQAYKEIAKTNLIYGPQPFLRLPLYLQKTGKNEEAWIEFNKLLTKGYPNQMKDLKLIVMDQSIIYDKMRLFLQREGKYEPAITYAVFSYLSWAIGLYWQNRNEELKVYTSYKPFQRFTRKLLKKLKKGNLFNEINDIVEEEVQKLPNINYTAIKEKITAIL